MTPWPRDALERVESCPLCGEPRRSPLFDGLTDRVFGCAPGVWSLQSCGGCGCAYLDPRPTRESVGRAYATYYTHGVRTAPRTRALRHALRNDDLRARYGYQLRPALPGGRFLRTPWGRCLSDRSVRWLALPRAESPTLLDIGCGDGGFLLWMRALGWKTVGLEPDPQAAAAARQAGLRIVEAALEEATLAAESFDAVTMSHVIEHLHDPADALRRVAALLRPGGVLVLATPNLDALGHTRFGRDWLGLDPPRHLVLFRPGALASLVEAAGLMPVGGPKASWAARWSFRSSQALALGAPDPLAKRALHGRMGALAQVRLGFDAVCANLRTLRQPWRGEELVLLARKPEGGRSKPSGETGAFPL